jgi:hypothetical protein
VASERVGGARNAITHWGQLKEAASRARAAAVDWGQVVIILHSPGVVVGSGCRLIFGSSKSAFVPPQRRQVESWAIVKNSPLRGHLSALGAIHVACAGMRRQRNRITLNACLGIGIGVKQLASGNARSQKLYTSFATGH